jgi:hypothetical protein
MGLGSAIMTAFSQCLRYLVLAALLGAAAVTQASAANWLEKNFYLIGPRYDGVLPPCEAGLSTIALRFSQKEGRFWNSDLQILGFDRVRETAFRPWAPQTVPRRYCTAVAAVSDGRHHTVHYSIIEDGGIIGMNWGVEWCVVGLDRNWAYNPACKMARP